MLCILFTYTWIFRVVLLFENIFLNLCQELLKLCWMELLQLNVRLLFQPLVRLYRVPGMLTASTQVRLMLYFNYTACNVLSSYLFIYLYIYLLFKEKIITLRSMPLNCFFFVNRYVITPYNEYPLLLGLLLKLLNGELAWSTRREVLKVCSWAISVTFSI